MTICHRESIKWFLSHCMSMYKFMYMYVYVCCTVCVKCPLLSRGVANICTSWLTFLSCITLTLTFPASITANSCTICYCMAWRVMSCHVMALSDIITSDVLSYDCTEVYFCHAHAHYKCYSTGSIGISRSTPHLATTSL